MMAQKGLAARAPDPKLDQIIKLAVMAVGGQGGGVLTNWIEDVARSNGYACQATSVAGVAQRTGATIYYIEMAPLGPGVPVFALAPAGGDVDVLIAAEMMEAGRAILRGFVTPDRTTLIASTHRALAVSEKMVPGDGIASSAEVRAAAEIAAQRVVMFDMEELAIKNGSVISASLLGALAGAGALPFQREAFEQAIRASGRGVAGSLQAFAAAFEVVKGKASMAAAVVKALPRTDTPNGPAKLLAAWEMLKTRVATLPAPVAEFSLLGLKKTVDFQGIAYGEKYIAHVEAVLARDTAAKNHALTREAAKYIANAMTYDDIIRVADIKTRSSRFARIRNEMAVKDGHVLHLTEFMHPRAEEIAGMLPAKLGANIQASPRWMAWLDFIFNKGRRLRTDSLGSFLVLYILGGLRGYRQRTLRHAQEMAHLDGWLKLALGYLQSNYDLAVEVIRCRRLVKGYSDTHARGLSKFDRVMEGIALVASRGDAADWARRLREAALKDEEGKALDEVLQTIRLFA